MVLRQGTRKRFKNNLVSSKRYEDKNGESGFLSFENKIMDMCK